MDNKIIFLLKFSDKKYLEKLILGELFMQPIKNFRDIEKSDNKKGRGDKNELKLNNKINKITFKKEPVNDEDLITQKLFKEAAQNGKIDSYVEYPNDKNLPIFCLLCLDKNKVKVEINEKTNKVKVLPCIHEDIKNEYIEDFGESVLVIKNPVAFIKRVYASCARLDIDVFGGFVTYLNTNDKEVFDIFKNKQRERFFIKDKNHFENQNEFRIVLNRQEDKPYTLSTESISDIAEILSVEEFFKSGIELDEKLYFDEKGLFIN